MKINLHQAYGLNEIGTRSNNEDSIYPSLEANSKEQENIFIVCDGVGGAAKGEEASRIVCEVLSKKLKNLETVNDENIFDAIKISENKIKAFQSKDEEAIGMGTTLTLLLFDSNGATIAHLGDSRVYHIRDGKIIFKTSDHSFVNELIENKIISEQEGMFHPKRNVVTKAIGYGFKKPDIHLVENVEADDYFFLCSDGIIESFSDEELLAVITDNKLENTTKINKIRRVCNAYSKDNFSAYLVQVKSVSDSASSKTLGGINMESALIYLMPIVLGIVLIVILFYPRKQEIINNQGVENGIYLESTSSLDPEKIGLDVDSILSKIDNEQIIENDSLSY